MRSEEHQRNIDNINRWVQEYKDGDIEAGWLLIKQFKPFLIKQSNRWNRIYQGVHPWDHIEQEAQVIFLNLLNEYTIGGNAYFNVYIERKLPLRLRYYFIKEIKRRTRYLDHDDQQIINTGKCESTHDIDEFIEDDALHDRLQEIYKVLGDPSVLTDRERDMVIRNIMHRESHESIAKGYGISRSRVSRIIKAAVEKLQDEVRWR